MSELTTKLPRRFKLLLFVSLALNLAVAGLVAGALLRGGPDGHGRWEHRRDPVLWSLERGDRKAVGHAVKEATGGRKASRAALKALTQELIVVLRATPFDEAALRELISRKGEVMRQMRDAGEATIARRIVLMSDAERQAFAARIEAYLERAAERRKSRKDRSHRE